ncbi:MAG: TetR/AcrR family transcriptional regulator [Kibdelosporangium sp.]
MTQRSTNGRVNQKLRTRNAIVRAATELIQRGRAVTMPEVAQTALVSEATAYRHFPDLVSLLQEAIAGQLFRPAEALEPVADSRDPVERIAVATEYLLRHVVTHQTAIRVIIAATITQPANIAARPGLRFGLIDEALAPLAEDWGTAGAPALAQLKRDLAVVVSAEALFALTDLCELPPAEAVASAVRTATRLTRAALAEHGEPRRPRTGTITGTITGSKAGHPG